MDLEKALTYRGISISPKTKNNADMKEDWVVVFTSAQRSEAVQIKRLLQRLGVETYSRKSAGPVQETKIYAPEKKAAKAVSLLHKQTYN